MNKLFIILAILLYGVSAHAQTKIAPGTQINWPVSCTSGQVYSPSGNTCVSSSGFAGPIVYPAICQQSGKPSWCVGTTSDAYIRDSCAQIPATGGVINLLGLTGTIAASVTCSTPTKQIIMLEDPTSLLTVTETDGGITFPLDNNSMFLGPGAGQCGFPLGGIHLGTAANITAMVGPVHTDGTQEDFTASGLCLYGDEFGTSTVTKGLLYSKLTFVNTTIENNNTAFCNTSCMWLENVGGMITVANNEFDVTAGSYHVIGSPIVIASTGSNTGCVSSDINIWGGNAEHANGGVNYPEINIKGNGAGAFPCNIYIHDVYMERNIAGEGTPPAVPSTVELKVLDCWSCNFSNIQGLGGNGTPSGDLVNISQSATGRVQNVTLNNVSGAVATNVVNDTTLGGSVIQLATTQFVTSYYSNPGYVQPPVLPGTVIQSLGTDLTGGQGSFSTGSAFFGTNFSATGCTNGTVCTYTRTNSTAPPGYTYSQEVQITTNPGGGINGLIYVPAVSVTSGTNYVAGVWAKGDGTYQGAPTFVLGNESSPPIYCYNLSPLPLTTNWTYYTFNCTATSSTSTLLNIGTTSNKTGTFWLAGFTFSPLSPLTPGYFTTVVAPYGLGTSVNGTSISAGAGAPTATCGTAPTANGSLYLRTDGSTGTSLYKCESGTWVAE